jgi:hypothetical protein
MVDHRAHFDARVEFANGGGLTAEGFRLDVPSADVTEAEVGRLFVQHLGLALVGSVTLTRFSVVEEQHRGSRGMDAAGDALAEHHGQQRPLDLRPARDTAGESRDVVQCAARVREADRRETCLGLLAR